MKYKAVLERSEEGFSVHAPGLPGCWSQGDTEAEALANFEDAIREYLAAVTEVTQEPPDQNADGRPVVPDRPC